MTMAAAASKQGIILGRLWKARLLSRSKRSKENKKLMKIPKRAKKKEKKIEENCPPIFRENGLSSGYYIMALICSQLNLTVPKFGIEGKF